MSDAIWAEDTYCRTASSATDPLGVVAAVDEPDEDVGEIEIADYLVFLFALDTYMRYIEESSEVLPDLESSLDLVLRKGLALLRVADRVAFGALERLLRERLTSKGSLKMLDAVMRTMPTARGAAMRALRLRTILSRGGSATAKAVFGTSNRARREVLDAIEATMEEDADAALNKFAAITLRNKRVEKWIDQAAAAAVPLVPLPGNPVQEAANKVTGQAAELQKSQVTREGAGVATEDAAAETSKQKEVLRGVEEDAREAAKKSLQQSGDEDRPLTKSEVIGVATAVAVAQAADPDNPRNVPPAFINGGFPLDAEQQAAALTDGRVLVAAGAGAGKSTTLVSRIAYLIQERNVPPNRIMAVTFNRKAANELITALQKKLGDAGSQVACDTMHTLFKRFIIGNPNTRALGTREEQNMLGPKLIATPQQGRGRGEDQHQKSGVSPSAVAAAIRGIWKDCGPAALANLTGFPEDIFEEKPKSKKSQLYISRWQGNDVSLDDAKANARSRDEQRAAVWYNLYLGLKGDLGGGWRPPCGMGKSYQEFMKKHRPGGERLGDMDDMLKVLRDILRRDVDARKFLQGAYDHILVDECQDLNTVQHQIFEMISEHITEDSKDKSIWMVGDDKQAIYQFRGAKPKLFQALKDKPGWKVRMIRTNYRCPPEVIEHANKLISLDEDRIPMDSQPSPYRKRGEASILVSTPADNTEAAINTLDAIRKDLVEGGDQVSPADYAVLSRTRMELNDFETACIINEIPYIRQGGRGFLDAPETKCVLGYMDLAVGTDYAKMRKSLAAALLKPDRGLYLPPDEVEKIVDETFDDIARRERVSIDSINPTEVLNQRQYARMLADNLKKRFKLKIIGRAKNPRTGEWVYNKFVDALTEQIQEMGLDVDTIREKLLDPTLKTADLLDGMLDNIKSTIYDWDPVARREVPRVTTLRDQISNDVDAYGDDEDEDEEETAPDSSDAPVEFDEEGHAIREEKELKKKGLGSIQFLYELAKQNPNDLTHGTDPEMAEGFQKKLARYEKLASTLRVDPVKWAKEQKKLPADQRTTQPQAVTLSTVHSVKGAQWKNVTVLMPKGKFPLEPKPKPGEAPPSEEEMKEQAVSERNLGYVALTRAASNLAIVALADPKTGALSPYIAQAGLVPGENVPKPESGAPPEASGEGKTASYDPLDEVIEQMVLRFASETPDLDGPSYRRV